MPAGVRVFKLENKVDGHGINMCQTIFFIEKLYKFQFIKVVEESTNCTDLFLSRFQY